MNNIYCDYCVSCTNVGLSLAPEIQLYGIVLECLYCLAEHQVDIGCVYDYFLDSVQFGFKYIK